ncbi:MAG: hypothetical protein MUF58_15975 [Arcicella sp.]|jgi:hypothetical protein|nr:hypothetical protein [Arcicella sp.]
MKLIILFTSIFLLACTAKEDQLVSAESTSVSIIGKWSPTYLTQARNADGTWGAWQRINTFVALPVYEFTSDGRFLTDGKPGANCCFAGNKYAVAGNTVSFSEVLICPNALCLACPSGWTIIDIKSDTLVLEECSTRNKYLKVK